MAGIFQQFLQGATNGFLDRPNLRDFTHANKTFTTTAYSNAPKFKWLFHVYFEINKDAVAGTSRGLVFPDTVNYGLLVKSIDLPKFNFDLVELNQYNRKRYAQTKIKYEPVRIAFHDDNANQIRQLWFNYYSYYYNDPNNPQGRLGSQTQGISTPDSAAAELNRKNIYQNVTNQSQLNWGYSAEISDANATTTNGTGTNYNVSKVPFFRSVYIYGFNQHNFSLYQLINPMVESFQHDNYSYTETSGIMENNMSLRYETVKYYDGAINGRNPGEVVKSFADPGVYDRTLSPIARPGSNANILGKNGLVESATGILDDLSPGGNPLRALQTAGRLSRTFKNPQAILRTAQQEILNGVTGAISNPNTARSTINTPALGANSGPGSQQSNATNALPTTAPPVNPQSNTPAT